MDETRSYRHYAVSIPNGMEFYENLEYDFYSIDSRFNSQRDGILPTWPTWRAILLNVSIPNGMEFYCRAV